jgi:hypothetical protein
MSFVLIQHGRNNNRRLAKRNSTKMIKRSGGWDVRDKGRRQASSQSAVRSWLVVFLGMIMATSQLCRGGVPSFDELRRPFVRHLLLNVIKTTSIVLTTDRQCRIESMSVHVGSSFLPRHRSECHARLRRFPLKCWHSSLFASTPLVDY